MKSSLLVFAALLMLTSARPAAAMSVDHDSGYADASGGSRFSDPDDALGGDDGNSNPLRTMQFGSSGSGDVSYGMYGNSPAQNNVESGYGSQSSYYYGRQ